MHTLFSYCDPVYTKLHCSIQLKKKCANSLEFALVNDQRLPKFFVHSLHVFKFIMILGLSSSTFIQDTFKSFLPYRVILPCLTEVFPWKIVLFTLCSVTANILRTLWQINVLDIGEQTHNKIFCNSINRINVIKYIKL